MGKTGNVSGPTSGPAQFTGSIALEFDSRTRISLLLSVDPDPRPQFFCCRVEIVDSVPII